MNALPFTIRLNRRLASLLIGTTVLLIFGFLYYTTYTGPTVYEHIPLPPQQVGGGPPNPHPIDTLRGDAENEYHSLLAKETRNVAAAAIAYQERRGRRPPPGFDKWFAFAQANNAVIVEDMFDRIYHDLGPYWAIPAAEIREQANNFTHRISVRSGKASTRSDEVRPWMDLWGNLVGTIAEHLPDLDMAINVMDETRVVAPWETVDQNMQVEKYTRRIVGESEAIPTFNATAVIDESTVSPVDYGFEGMGTYWDKVVKGCAPDSPARADYTPESDFTAPPPLPTLQPEHSWLGYVRNWTLTKSPCDNPSLQGLHGTFVEPISMSTTHKLIPLFGGCKLPMNNDILLPPAMYWTDDPMYSGGDTHGGPWENKNNQVIWRGAASGGRNKPENWARFQRHRFVSMMNGTSVKQAEIAESLPPNIEIPTPSAYDVLATTKGYIGDWISRVADAAFVHLVCFPENDTPRCPYTDPYYEVAHTMSMAKQYKYKYLPDIDGNSFSGRYRGFLASTSLPIKATIYEEWHDSRLVPWKHFVPMDNTFVDVYGILDYFIGFDDKHGRDDVAKKIALEGKEWANRVLRREDMQIYVFRLLLEYGRLCDDNRELLGWIPHKP